MYNPDTGRFTEWNNDDCHAYGKGTKTDGGTKADGYGSKVDYTKGSINVAIFPFSDPPKVEIAWKEYKKGSGGRNFIGWGADGYSGSYPKQVIYLSK